MRLFRTRIPTDSAMAFVHRHVRAALLERLREPELAPFVRLVLDGQDAAAQKEYRRLTGADLNECYLAVRLVRAERSALQNPGHGPSA